jgi:2-methylcitrate dehydratase PrpD
MNVTKNLADFVETVQYQNLPIEAIDLAKPLILDSLGVSMAGAACPIGRMAVKLGRETRDGADATVIGTGYSTSVSSAAFINGTLAHALDIDDTAAGTIAHPSASIVPALFALAEKYRLSGKAFLTAYILGLEVFYRISLASQGQMGGWHRTSVYGALAAAAASAKLLNFSSEQIRTAIGIGTSLTAGVQVNFGTMTKAIQVGNASRSGVLAALLAKEGCTAHQDALGDPIGFGFAFYAGRFDTEKIVADLGNPYNILFPGVGVKIYPCCGLTHSPADIVLDLVRTHDICADQVEEVTIYGEELLPQVLVYHRPETGYQGKYSLEYVAAAAILDRELTTETFTDDRVNRPEIQAYLGKINGMTRPDSEWESVRIHPWNHPTEVIIRFKDGTACSGKAPCARGYPDLPLTTEEICNKFRSGAKQTLPAETIEKLSQQVLTLEARTDVADVIALTRNRREDR